MPELFFKKMVILGKNDSTSEKDIVEVSAVKLVDLKIENKLNFPVSLKKIKPKEIEAIDDFLEECNLVIFGFEDWEKILKKLSIQPENVLDLKELSEILLPRLKEFKLETVAQYFNLDSTYSRK